MRVEIYPSALSKIIDFAATDLRRESAGFLIGKIEEDKLQITDSSMTSHSGTAGYVVVEDTEMAEIAEELSNRGENEKIIGWWHSHPRMGAGFMSRTDVTTQEKYQKMFPQAIALIIDPVKFIQTSNIEDLDYKCYTVADKIYKPLKVKIAEDKNKILLTTFKSLKRLRIDIQRVLKKTYEKDVTLETQKIKNTSEAHSIILILWTIALTITIALIVQSL
ncbi:MAG: Mov34/MPN/PAD-1 family protein [Candidatus Jordarchaeum sp.]|uniref:Mov34/MPN/PAD-1 family protein n=1 Tax=Candidatus Jordarchaeum sp. TaxID=2823881 RepID=UPI00404B429B